MPGEWDVIGEDAEAAAADPWAVVDEAPRRGNPGRAAVQPIPAWDEPEVPDQFVMPSAPLPEVERAPETPMEVMRPPAAPARTDTIQFRDAGGQGLGAVRLPVPAWAEAQQPPEMPDPREFTRPQPANYEGMSTGQRAGQQLRSGVETLRQGLTSMGLGGLYDEIDALNRLDRGEPAPEVNDPQRPVPIGALPPEQRAAYRASLEEAAGRRLASIVGSQNRQALLASNPRARALVEQLNAGNWRQAWGTFASDPAGIIQQFSVESAPLSVPMMAAGVTGGLLGGPAAGAVASFLGSYGTEFGPRQVEAVMEALRARGVDTSDERAVQAHLRTNPRLAVEAAQAAARGALGPAVFDAAGMGAARGIRPGAGALRNTGRVARNLGVELLGEPAGEATGQLLQDGQVKPGELAAELLGAGPQVVGTTAYGTVMEARQPAAPASPAPPSVRDPRLPPEAFGPPVTAVPGALGQIIAGSPGGPGAAAAPPAAPPPAGPAAPAGGPVPAGNVQPAPTAPFAPTHEMVAPNGVRTPVQVMGPAGQDLRAIMPDGSEVFIPPQFQPALVPMGQAPQTPPGVVPAPAGQPSPPVAQQPPGGPPAPAGAGVQGAAAPIPQAAPRVQVGANPGSFSNQNAQSMRDLSDQRGLTTEIEVLFAEGLTAAQVHARMAEKLKFLPYDEQKTFIVLVRATLGIPSQSTTDGQREFADWKKDYLRRTGQTTATTEQVSPPQAAPIPAPAPPPPPANPLPQSLAAALAAPSDAQLAQQAQQRAEAVATLQAQLPPGWRMVDDDGTLSVLAPNGEALYGHHYDAPPGDPQALLAEVRQVDEAGRRSGIYPNSVDAAAAQTNPSPTPGQAQAGNYAQGPVTLHGIHMRIETRRGATRSGVGKDGQPWSVQMPAHYGRIEGTTGADGDQVDVYLGPQAEDANAPVFVVDQIDPETGRFDEHKAFMGWPDEAGVVATYDAAFSDGSGPGRRVALRRLTLAEFKAWLASGQTSKPLNPEAVRRGILARRQAEEAQKQAEQQAAQAEKEAERVRKEAEAKARAEDKARTRDDARDAEIHAENKRRYGVERIEDGTPEQMAAWIKDHPSFSLSDLSAILKASEAYLRARVLPLVEKVEAPATPAPEDVRHKPPESDKPAGGTTPATKGNAEATTGEYGTPDAPRMVPLARAFADAFLQHTRFSSIGQARTFAAKLLGGAIQPNSVAAKALDEAIEGGVVLAARQIVEMGEKGGWSPRRVFEGLVELYGQQPRLDVRTSGSRERQAYSTPAPLAFLAASIAAAGRDGRAMRWIEPTAGTGQLLILADPENVDVAEIDPARASFLRDGVEIPGTAVQVGDATEIVWDATEADAVIGNPPFGLVRADGTGPAKRYRGPGGFLTTHIDHAIMLRALAGLKDDGMAVFIVGAATNDDAPEGKRKDGYNSDGFRSLFRQLFENYNVLDHFTVAGALYERQGAAWPVDVIVVAGRGKTTGRRYPTGNLPRIYRSWEELSDAVRPLIDAATAAREALGQPAADGVGASPQPGADGGAGAAAPGGAADGSGGLPAPGAGQATGAGQPGSGNPGGGNGADAGAGSGGSGGGRPPVNAGGASVRDDGGSDGRPAGGRPGDGGMAGDAEPGATPGAGVGGGDGAPGVAAPGGAAGSGDDVAGAFDSALDDVFGKDEAPPAPAGDVSGAFDNALDDVFGPSPEAGGKSPPPAPNPAGNKAPAPEGNRPPGPRTAGGAATSAIKNTISGADQAMAGLTQLFGGGKLNSGLGWSEDTWNAAKPLFAAAVQKFKAAASDIGQMMKLLLTELRDAYQWTREMVMQARPYIERFVSGVKAGEISLDTQPETPAPNEKPVTPPAPRAAREAEKETDLQVAYAPASKAEAVGTLAPVNMRDAMQEALAKLTERVGEPDQFVADRLGYTLDEVVGVDGKPGYFSAEQVDALALAFDAIDKGAGFVIGDQTGVGKGRFVAAMLRYAKRQGLVPIFVTKDPGLYGDMYRDTNAIGMPDFTAAVTNNNLRGKDAIPLPARPGTQEQDGERTLQTAADADHKQMIADMTRDGSLPKGVDALFTTYSQLQRVAGKETRRHDLLRSLAPGAMFVLDESHEAGGTENVKVDKDGNVVPTRADFVRELIQLSRGTVYSSATWAKNPHVTSLYSKTDLGMIGAKPEDLPALMSSGGVPLQQTVSNMLTEAGQYVRRERSFAGVDVEPMIVNADLEVAERFAETLRELFAVDKMMEPIRESFAAEYAADTGNAGAANGSIGTAGLSMSPSGFASVMHNLIAQGLLAAKTVAVVDNIIESLQAGRKPVIALSNTMGAALADYFSDPAQRVNGVLPVPTFNYLLRRYVERMRRVTFKDPQNPDVPIYVTMTDNHIKAHGGQDALAEYNRGMARARMVDLGALPVSPIDFLRQRLTEAGFKVDEITGRGLQLDYSVTDHAATTPRDGGAAAKKRIMAAFNRGDLDAVILNRSGSTGFSLHASRDFKDQRQREMFVLQAEPDINIMMQVFGRIHRTGQVVLPRYAIVLADLAGEKRPAARLMKNLAGLNANTSSSKKNAFSIDAPDIFNKYGDQAARQVLQEEADLARLLDVAIPSGEPPPGYAGKVTGRFAILEQGQQQQLWDRLEAAFNNIIEILDSTGQNDLEAKTLDLDAKTEGTIVLVPETDPNTPFGREALLERINIKSQGKPFTAEEIGERIEKNLGQNDKLADWQAQAEAYQEEQRARLANLGQDAAKEAEAALLIEDVKDRARASDRAAAKSAALAKQQDQLNENMNAFRNLLAEHKVGNTVSVEVGHETLIGIIVNMTWKPGKNPLALGALTYTVAVADPIRQLDITGASLQSARAKMVSVPYVAFITKLENVSNSDRRETRFVVTGNLAGGFAAISQMQVGKQFAMFTAADGTVRPGVLLSRQFRPDQQLANLPVKFSTTDQVIEFLSGLPAQAIVDSDDGVLTVQALDDGRFMFRVKIQGGKPYYLNRAARAAMTGGEFVQRRGDRHTVGMAGNAAEARAALDAYADALGTTYQTDTQKGAARRVTGEAEMTERPADDTSGGGAPAAPPGPNRGALLYSGFPIFDLAGWKRFIVDPVLAGSRALGQALGKAAAAVKAEHLGVVKRLWQRPPLPPGVTVDDSGRTPNRLTPGFSRFRLPTRMFRQWPALAALVDQGIRAEERMSIWSTRMGGRLDTILGGLKKAGGDQASVMDALLAADADSVDIEDAAVAAQHFADAGLNEAEARAAGAVNRLLVQAARLVDQHRRAMLPRVRERMARVWTNLAAIMDSASVPGEGYAKAYRRRGYLNVRIRDGKGDAVAQAAEVATINAKLRAMRAADPEIQARLSDLQDEYDSLEARMAATSVRRRRGYFPHKFFGNWRLFQMGEADPDTGEREKTEITSDQGFYDTLGQAIAAARTAREADPSAQLRIEPRMVVFPGGAGSGGAVLSDQAYFRLRRGIEEAAGLDGDALNDALKGVAQRRSRRRMFTPGLFRKGAEGFSKDMERVLRTHIAQTTRYVEMDKLKFRYVETTERMGLSPGRAKAVEKEGMTEVQRTLESWWRDVNGNKQAAETQVDAAIERLGLPGATLAAFSLGAAAGGIASSPFLGVALGGYMGYRMARAVTKGGDFPTRTFMGDISSDLAHLKLGMLVNLGSATVNLTQTLVNTWPVLGERWTAIGVKRATAALWSQVRNSGNPGRMSTDAILLTRADIATRFSLASDAPPLLVESRGITDRLRAVSMMPFHSVEVFNRAVAFLGAYARAEAGGATPAAAMEQGRQVLRRTQFHQGQAARPEVLRNTLLRLPTQFKNFLAQQVGFALGLEGKGQVLRFLVGIFLVAGLLGLPGMQLFDWLLKMMIGESPITWMKDRIITAGALGQTAGTALDVLGRGLPALLGMDISGRVGMGGGFLPDSGSDMAGPALGTVAQLREIAAQGGELVDYLFALSPMAQPLRALEAAANGSSITSERFWTGGVFGDGESRLTNPRKRGQTEYQPTNRELVTMGMGFRPLRQALLADAREVQATEEAKRRERQNGYLARIITAHFDGRPERIGEISAEARRAGVGLTPKQIREALRDAIQDRAQRDIKRAPRATRPAVIERNRAIEGRFQ